MSFNYFNKAAIPNGENQCIDKLKGILKESYDEKKFFPQRRLFQSNSQHEYVSGYILGKCPLWVPWELV